jgi:hypothetical protein
MERYGVAAVEFIGTDDASPIAGKMILRLSLRTGRHKK